MLDLNQYSLAELVELQQQITQRINRLNQPKPSLELQQLTKEYNSLNSEEHFAKFSVEFKLQLKVKAFLKKLDAHFLVPDISNLFAITVTPTVLGDYAKEDSEFINNEAECFLDQLCNDSGGLKIVAPDLHQELQTFTTKVTNFRANAKETESFTNFLENEK